MYTVYGYSDENPEKIRPLMVFATKAKAIDYASINGMATCVEDDDEVIVWQR